MDHQSNVWSPSGIGLRTIIIFNLCQWYAKYLFLDMFFFGNNRYFLQYTVENVDVIIGEGLKSLHTWFNTNQLSMDITKTNFMVFKNRKQVYIPQYFKPPIIQCFIYKVSWSFCWWCIVLKTTCWIYIYM